MDRQAAQPPPYQDNFEHIADELQMLDLLIRRRVMVLRRQLQEQRGTSADPTLYISHEEVDRLLDKGEAFDVALPEFMATRDQLAQQRYKIDARIAISRAAGIFLTLPQLTQIFALSPFERQVLTICLAPELNRKYDQLYAYLQNDITRKRPSVDLVLDLLCETVVDKWRARTHLSDQAPLFRSGILQPVDDPHSPSGSSGLAQFIKLDQRIFNYILENNSLDGRLYGAARVRIPAPDQDNASVDPTIKTKLCNLTRHHFNERAEHKKLVLYLHGPYGTGKQALALAICGSLNSPMIYVDLELLLASEQNLATLLQLAFREGLLSQAALFVDHADVLLAADEKARVLVRQLSQVIEDYGWLVFLGGEKPWSLPGAFDQAIFQTVNLPVPDVPLRTVAWREVLRQFAPHADESWPDQLAAQFQLTPGQIRDAVVEAQNRWTMGDGAAAMTLDDLYAACRSQSNQKLSELAVKLEPRTTWADVILPDEKLDHLREICSQVRHHYRVFGEWGFDQKLSHGKGLSVLFFGLPGTGKTMAAEVITHDLQLDLYKVDLSGVVSKYIGETEKNLSKIFQEAETSNAILFFDEADALFGKRTEVSDAHDRYANIETSYLLQKMEEYAGVVILATNLRENMDEAFTRRIRLVIEFPFPDVASRREIWRTHFPRQAPVSEAIDYDLLAQHLPIAGGNIKNIVLNAAFFAAENGGVIGLEHIVRGGRREFEKIGKLWREDAFTASRTNPK
ncbi:ATP-binding protein [Chloroflexi bacterium TSY]|nr:ATP-binding protein [Chloroflexi bacterium TSY]